MEPVNNNRVDFQQQQQPERSALSNSLGAMGRASTAIAVNLGETAQSFMNSSELIVSKILSFLKKRGNEHFGEIAASSKLAKTIADSLVVQLNVPQEGVETLIAKLTAGDYKDLESLKLPDTLTDNELVQVLNVARQSGVKIRELNLSICHQITHLPGNLPPGLITLNISNCYRITQIPNNLPATLRHFDASECYDITRVPTLPPSLETLKLNFCDGIIEITEPFPENMQKLELIECSSLEELPPHLPSKLLELNLRGCGNLLELPEELPVTLRSLNIRGCDSLEDLPENLPEGLLVNR